MAPAVPHGMARGRVAVSIQGAGVERQRLLTLRRDWRTAEETIAWR